MTKAEKKILVLTSIFIAIALNVHRLFVLLPGEGRNIGLPWVFNGPELGYQTFFQFGFSVFFGYLNLSWLHWIKATPRYKVARLLAINAGLFVLFYGFGCFTQYILFSNVLNVKLFLWGYLFRLLTSMGLIAIMVKIVLMNRVQKRKEQENEQLRTAYFDAEIKNLRAQINPHFLFNALSSLSALVRENPGIAQDYITHLSKVFRYSLSNHHEQLIGLEKELELLESNIQLLKMRFEEGLDIHTEIPKIVGAKIPHMSLQPLLENAVKHNYVSKEKPLRIDIFVDNGSLHFRNTLNEAAFKEPSTGIGLLNLNERYNILLGKSIEIEKTENHFLVKLPLN
ncbi:sensor histidine kinase [Flagellimonas aurea]|uniref:sensor histidine kinase n=1 Tax=Flagellimonas aurea TaxID=2915619 RepID=UPI0035CF446A